MSSTHLDLPPLRPPRVEEVSDGVYAYVQPDGTWWINNTGFLVGGRGVTSIDACSTERRTPSASSAISTVPSPSCPARLAAARSTSARPWPTWLPTTAADP
jgi:cyclase